MPSSRPSVPVPVLLAVVFALVLASPPAAARAAGDSVPGVPEFSAREASAAPELEVTFEEAAVLAADLTPGGEAVFFSLAREPQGFFNRIVRRADLAVVDAQGEARFDVEGGAVPLKSVWAVADLSSGAFAVAAPPGFRLHEIGFPDRPFEVGAPGVVNRLRHRFAAVDLLLVRPGVGAWSLTAWDTGPADRDGEDDDATVTAVGDMEPLGPGPPPPERFARDDVLVVVHPRDLRFYATRLLGPPETGGSP